MIDYFCNEGALTPGDAVAALIVLDDGRYLMQLRDQKPGIFYPGHWGYSAAAWIRAKASRRRSRASLRRSSGWRVPLAVMPPT